VSPHWTSTSSSLSLDTKLETSLTGTSCNDKQRCNRQHAQANPAWPLQFPLNESIPNCEQNVYAHQARHTLCFYYGCFAPSGLPLIRDRDDINWTQRPVNQLCRRKADIPGKQTFAKYCFWTGTFDFIHSCLLNMSIIFHGYY